MGSVVLPDNSFPSAFSPIEIIGGPSGSIVTIDVIKTGDNMNCYFSFSGIKES